MKIAYKNPNTYIIIAVDAILLYFSLWLAHWLRFESLDNYYYQNFFPKMVFPIVLVKLVVFAAYGLQSGMWRYTSVIDLLNIIKATFVSFLIIVLGLVYYYYPDLSGNFSRAVLIIDFITTIFFISAFRLSIRLYHTTGHDVKTLLNSLKPSWAFKTSHKGIPALIYGAGERGELLLRSLMNQPKASHYQILGLISADPRHGGVNIHGYPVLGGLEHMEKFVGEHSVKEVLVAARISGDNFEEIHSICRAHNIEVRVVPPYFDGRHNKIDVTSLRNMQIEDLLGRNPVSIDFSKIEKMFKGRRALITGAGGSIGSQLAMRIAEFGPSQIVMVDKGENYLHQLEVELCKYSDSIDLVYCCANIVNQEKMASVFDTYKPEFVLHAAAHKHVPMMERNMDEAIRNNIGGMKVVSNLADKFGVKRFILISTDKAVNPGNVMGVTKRICELYLQNIAQTSKTHFMAVRFGNVLGSNGSVVPLFMKQIEHRGPVTVTHQNMTRYFMTIPEAVLLILQSIAMEKQGGLFLLDMGEPVKILDLAKKMILMGGFEVDKDIDIVFTGLRPGEKMEEELIGAHEQAEKTTHPKIDKIRIEGEPWAGVEKLVDQALRQVTSDPDGAYRDIISWLKKPDEKPSSKIIDFPSSTSREKHG